MGDLLCNKEQDGDSVGDVSPLLNFKQSKKQNYLLDTPL